MPFVPRWTLKAASIAVIPVVCFVLGPLAARGEQGFQAADWTVEALSWTFSKDGVQTTLQDEGMAVHRQAPVSRRVTVEAEVRVDETAGDNWKIAGLVIQQDGANFWHFALIESPPDQQRRHYVELAEMRDGQWLAHNSLKRTVDESAGPSWSFGRKYRLRLALDPEGVEGELFEAGGRRLRKIRYAFSGTAVTTGRPAIRSHGCRTDFTAIRVAHSEPAATPRPDFPPYRCASHVPKIHGEATGFFHVQQDGGKWWVVDPLGRGFVPLGVDHVRYEGHWCEKLGYHPHQKKNDRKYTSRDQWAEETLGRLKSWGFNLLGAGGSRQLFHRGLAHTQFAGIGSSLTLRGGDCEITPHEGRPCSAFPNVFHPHFERYCQAQAYRLCEANRGNPWLFGYFLDNELAWWGRGGLETGLFDAVMSKPADHSAKQALIRFLRRRYEDDVARVSTAWGVQLDSFDDLAKRQALSGDNQETVTADKQAFLALIAERYFATITAAIRRVDPDHMILGSRFAGGHCSEVVWQAAARHCDILTFNYYGNVDLDRRLALDHQHDCNGEPLGTPFDEFYRMGGRPMMVTEWSFPAIDSGLPCTRGAGQRFRTQAERAQATDIFARTMLRMPYIVGYSYFMWVDEPALGITSAFPENTNYGLIDEDGRPYELLTQALTGVHNEAAKLRSQPPVAPALPPPARLPSGRPGREVALSIAGMPSDASAQGPPHAALKWHRDEKGFRMETEAFTFRGTLDGSRLIDRVDHRGVSLGWYNALVQQWVGHNRWVEINRLVDAQAEVGPRAATLDLIGRYQPPDSGERAHPFEICHRLTLLPDRDWFVIELLWCRNPGPEPLDVRAFFFRPHGAIGGSPEHDVPLHENSVPRLWGRPDTGGWIDESAGAYFGVAAPRREGLAIFFWLNEHDGQHPDARWERAVTIKSGETYSPPRPVWLLALAGRGDRLAFDNASRLLVEQADREATSPQQQPNDEKE